MSTRAHHAVRRIGALAIIPVVLLLSACGLKYDITINSDDTVDFRGIVWGDQLSESDCQDQQETFNNGGGHEVTFTFTEYEGQPACDIAATDAPLSEFRETDEENGIVITHEGDLYILEWKLPNDGGASSGGTGGITATLTVTFPGEVTEATGNTKEIDGNTVTWTDLTKETETLRAEGKDSSGLPWLPILLGVIALAVIAGIIILIIVLKNKKKQQAVAASSFGDPAQGFGQPQPYQQPGYNQGQPQGPGQPQPYQQPGYNQGQPQNPAQPQPYQQPGQNNQQGQPGQNNQGQPPYQQY